MEKITAKFIVITVGILIVLNIGLLGMLWVKKARPQQQAKKPIEEVNAFIIKELGFDEEQAKKFIDLAAKHHSIQVESRESFGKLKFELNQKLLSSRNFNIDSAAAQLAEITHMKEREFYRFFIDVMQICNDNQKRRLQKVFFEATGPPDHAKMPFDQRSTAPPPPR